MENRYIAKINGATYILNNAVVFYRRAGRAVRRWHKFVRGVANGILYTLCQGIANIGDVVRNVASEKMQAVEKMDSALSQQRMLLDAAIGV
jgi:hypothetical protein